MLPTPTQNISQQQAPQFEQTPIWMATVVMMVFMIIAIVLGNVLVLVTTWLDKHLHEPNKYFIACLAVADLLVGVFSVPIRLRMQLDLMKLWPITLCRFWYWIDIFCEAASIVTLTVISIDRCYKISEPFKYRSRMDSSRSAIVIVCIWIISAAAATFGLTSFGGITVVRSQVGRGCLNDNKIYYTIVFVVFFFFPSLILLFMYSFIFYIAHQRQKKSRRGELGQSVVTPKKQGWKKHRQEMKTIRMLSVVVFTFILCWGPSFVLLLIHLYSLEHILALSLHDYQIIGRIFIVILPPFNSLCNPIIYAWCDRKYSNAFKHLLKKYIICRFKQDSGQVR